MLLPVFCVSTPPDYPGAVHPRVPIPAYPATGRQRRGPGGAARLEKAVPLFLSAAALGHHDRKHGPHRLDHKGHELLCGEYKAAKRYDSGEHGSSNVFVREQASWAQCDTVHSL